jgi:hypothetical protein
VCLTQISEGIFGLAFPVFPSDLHDAEWAVLYFPLGHLPGLPLDICRRKTA